MHPELATSLMYSESRSILSTTGNHMSDLDQPDKEKIRIVPDLGTA